MNDQPIFDHEKLDVYQVELSFIAWSSLLLSEIRAAEEGLYREVCDQLVPGSSRRSNGSLKAKGCCLELSAC
jgi:hypothetical protein